MKTFTITIQPCKSPVTITIHADGVATAPTVRKTQSQVVRKSKTDKWNVEYQARRAIEFLATKKGYCDSTEFYRKFFKSTGLLEGVTRHLEKFTVRKGRQRPTVYYVLPECVANFKRFVQKQGWKIAE